jgi:hypothetical protein
MRDSVRFASNARFASMIGASLLELDRGDISLDKTQVYHVSQRLEASMTKKTMKLKRTSGARNM